MSIDTLKKQLKAKEFSKLYLFMGEDGYIKKAYFQKLVDAAVDKNLRDFNLQVFDADNFDAARYVSAVQNMPLMGGYKCVALKDVDPDGLKADEWKILLSSIKEIPEQCIVAILFDAVAFDKKSSRFNTLLNNAKKYGDVVDAAKLTRSEAAKAAKKLVEKLGCTIAADTAAYLVEACGGDMARISAEIEKLSAYAAGGEIEKAAVDLLVDKPLEATIYTMASSVVAGSAEKSLRALDELFYQKQEPVIILSALSGAFCDLYRARAALSGGAGQSELTADFNYRGREFRIRNALRDCGGVSTAFLKKCLDFTFEADREIKSGSSDKRLALETVLFRITAEREKLRMRGGFRH